MACLHPSMDSNVGLLRSYATELLNTGLPDKYSINIETAPSAETVLFHCDARLVSRAVGNLVQNSIRHNPDGCDIALALDCMDKDFSLSISDNGIGLSAVKLKHSSTAVSV